MKILLTALAASRSEARVSVDAACAAFHAKLLKAGPTPEAYKVLRSLANSLGKMIGSSKLESLDDKKLGRIDALFAKASAVRLPKAKRLKDAAANDVRDASFKALMTSKKLLGSCSKRANDPMAANFLRAVRVLDFIQSIGVKDQRTLFGLYNGLTKPISSLLPTKTFKFVFDNPSAKKPKAGKAAKPKPMGANPVEVAESVFTRARTELVIDEDNKIESAGDWHEDAEHLFQLIEDKLRESGYVVEKSNRLPHDGVQYVMSDSEHRAVLRLSLVDKEEETYSVRVTGSRAKR